MHGRRLTAAALGAAALMVAAAPADARQVDVTESMSGTTVTVRTGDTIRISLPANETTGYRWGLVKRPDRSVARITRRHYRPDGGGMPGAGGTQIFRLRSTRSGRTRIAVAYAQVGSGTVGDTFSLRIRVRPRLS
ncbi:protease inhibitor I42 family protein [Capillimicrobium parvum]|uniref:Proteinase inhibitor I42 chagasin domain-containing protein n=1 Tax=Capillimicrobium parvum TaxID=2884022 RepID=A0A9E6XZ33_9ACTN|nr:protease inhibitor I42 family protein [Capillimicrobium parvum]UGS36607.1 hypothetical protein DSM104329_03015 [Capillimicrobium parvum]